MGSGRSAVFIASVALGISGSAATAGDVSEGRALVSRWCVSCHATGAAAKGTDAAPPFSRIANDPARTRPHLRAWLTNPHPPMPNLALSRIEIENILSWLDSLKRP